MAEDRPLDTRLHRLVASIEAGKSRWVERLVSRKNYQEPSMFGEETIAWGQYLDDPHFETQHGIYATAAVVQVLLDANQTDCARRAFRYLALAIDAAAAAPNDKAAKNRSLVMKHAAVMFTLGRAAGLEGHERTRAVVHDFLERAQHDDGSWGFYLAEDGRRGESHVIPTTHALLAYVVAGGTRAPRRAQALTWIDERLKGSATLRPAEVSLILQTLALYERADSTRIRTIFDAHCDRLRREQELWFSYMFPYPVRQSNDSSDADNRYHVINAQMCHLNALRAMGLKYILDPLFLERVERLASELRDDGAVRDPFSGRIETRTGCLAYFALDAIGDRITQVGHPAATREMRAVHDAVERSRAQIIHEERRRFRRDATVAVGSGVALVLASSAGLYFLGLPQPAGYLLTTVGAIGLEHGLMWLYRFARARRGGVGQRSAL